MIIKSIEIQNFRNYEYESIEFDDKTNILYGDNAQGKTNVLEAVFIAGTNKSHKGSKDSELINFNGDEAHIKAVVSKRDIDYRIDMHIRKSRSKGIAINGVPIRRSSELYGLVNIIFFSPEDLNIIKSGPSARRRFIDMELCQLDKIYVDNLIKYNKTLEQRNKLLKDIYFEPSLEDTLDIWNRNLVNYGSEIIKRRRIFIDKLNSIIEDIHYRLSGNKEHLVISYEESVGEDVFLQELNDNISRDKKSKMTGCGPHRDDIEFKINGLDVKNYASQGQQKTTVLVQKIAEVELFKDELGEYPVLLLDDIMSELDIKRREFVTDKIKNMQIFITCTDKEKFYNFKSGKFIEIGNGKIIKEG